MKNNQSIKNNTKLTPLAQLLIEPIKYALFKDACRKGQGFTKRDEFKENNEIFTKETI